MTMTSVGWGIYPSPRADWLHWKTVLSKTASAGRLGNASGEMSHSLCYHAWYRHTFASHPQLKKTLILKSDFWSCIVNSEQLLYLLHTCYVKVNSNLWRDCRRPFLASSNSSQRSSCRLCPSWEFQAAMPWLQRQNTRTVGRSVIVRWEIFYYDCQIFVYVRKLLWKRTKLTF